MSLCEPEAEVVMLGRSIGGKKDDEAFARPDLFSNKMYNGIELFV